jgi:hypothetical protein
LLPSAIQSPWAAYHPKARTRTQKPDPDPGARPASEKGNTPRDSCSRTLAACLLLVTCLRSRLSTHPPAGLDWPSPRASHRRTHWLTPFTTIPRNLGLVPYLAVHRPVLTALSGCPRLPRLPPLPQARSTLVSEERQYSQSSLERACGWLRIGLVCNRSGPCSPLCT